MVWSINKENDFEYDIENADSLERLREITNDFTRGEKFEEDSEFYEPEMTEYEFTYEHTYVLWNNLTPVMKLYYEVIRTINGKRTRLNMLQQVEAKFGVLEHTEDYYDELE
jgi:hypothetical protein